MADVTVAQFAEVLKVPVEKLLVQLDEAGIKVSGSDDNISDDAKLELLSHLRRSHGQDDTPATAAAPRRITLKRKSQSELRLSGTQGRSRTVNVEVRSKRTYIKRDVLEEQAQKEQATQPIEASGDSPLEQAVAGNTDLEQLLESPLMQALVNNDRNALTVAMTRAGERAGLEQMQNQWKGALRNRLQSPKTQFRDAWSVLNRPDDPRRKPPTLDDVDAVTLQGTEAVWTETVGGIGRSGSDSSGWFGGGWPGGGCPGTTAGGSAACSNENECSYEPPLLISTFQV